MANFWEKAFSERSCIVPADSFFEWRKVKTGKPKLPPVPGKGRSATDASVSYPA